QRDQKAAGCKRGMTGTGTPHAMLLSCSCAFARALGQHGVGCDPEQPPTSAGGDVTPAALVEPLSELTVPLVIHRFCLTTPRDGEAGRSARPPVGTIGSPAALGADAIRRLVTRTVGTVSGRG